MSFLLWILPLVGVNVAAVVAFAHDKAAAQRGERRIPEATLLKLALFGGSPGAMWARRRFRHKTRKQPFASQLDLIAMLHAGVAFGLGVAFLL